MPQNTGDRGFGYIFVFGVNSILMKREFNLILILVVVFVGINALFYFQILNKQLDFQTNLLERQVQICGNTIEQEGQRFENELNSIPYESDFTRLFTDEEIRQTGSVNLQKLYTGYRDLINKITVYDNENNVYSLIIDNKGNFVSDYYESQRQTALNDRDLLIQSNGKHQLTIPGFDEAGVVRSNIVVDLNYTRFIDAIFDRYGLEGMMWQWLVSDEGELISGVDETVEVPVSDLRKVGAEVLEINEGSFVHTITVDSVLTQVVSAYYPVRLVRQDLGIVFSIKTDLFLQSIVIKFIIVSVSSILLLGVFVYIRIRMGRRRSSGSGSKGVSEDSLLAILDLLPFGLIFVNPDGMIRTMNLAARQLVLPEGSDGRPPYQDLGLDAAPGSLDDAIYRRTFGPGVLLRHHLKFSFHDVYKMEWEEDISGVKTRIVLLIDVSEVENARTHRKLSEEEKAGLLSGTTKEIISEIDRIKDLFSGEMDKKGLGAIETLGEQIRRSVDLSGRQAVHAVSEDVPFSLSTEINRVLDPTREENPELSILVKVWDDVPDKIAGNLTLIVDSLKKLVENAVNTTKEGRVLISCSRIETNSGILGLQFSVEDTGEGMEQPGLEAVINDLYSGRIDPKSERDPFRLMLATVKRNAELMGGRFRFGSPSTISTNSDCPGFHCSFNVNVYPGENINENLVFKGVNSTEQVKCLVLSQQKETENEGLNFLEETGINPGQLVFREENTDSLFSLVAEKASSHHLLLVIHSPLQDGFALAEGLIRRGLNDGLILVVLSTDRDIQNSVIARNSAIDYYIEEPFGPHWFSDILSAHFPDIKGYGSGTSAGSEKQ